MSTSWKNTAHRLAGRAMTYAQTSQPVRTSALIRRLLASSSSSKKADHADQGRVAGLDAANRAARIPEDPAPLARTSGMAAAARAAGIPG